MGERCVRLSGEGVEGVKQPSAYSKGRDFFSKFLSSELTSVGFGLHTMDQCQV